MLKIVPSNQFKKDLKLAEKYHDHNTFRFILISPP